MMSGTTNEWRVHCQFIRALENTRLRKEVLGNGHIERRVLGHEFIHEEVDGHRPNGAAVHVEGELTLKLLSLWGSVKEL